LNPKVKEFLDGEISLFELAEEIMSEDEVYELFADMPLSPLSGELSVEKVNDEYEITVMSFDEKMFDISESELGKWCDDLTKDGWVITITKEIIGDVIGEGEEKEIVFDHIHYDISKTVKVSEEELLNHIDEIEDFINFILKQF